ncbi:opioid growth factor receptor [Microcaecilia unicolor]|uniref:Opioid growth factor receptor n=1 Tax=Microcaecilia unicolor TaxID=1415580 RepID=A0A6P7YYU6_9AMPH|nr:opioid growth factor receptor [Microcaecilia unicolor]
MALYQAAWEYDSTWEEEEEDEETESGDEDTRSEFEQRREPVVQEKKKQYWSNSYQGTKRPQRNWRAARDMQQYRHHYPHLQDREDEEEPMWNLKFYKNEVKFLPNGIKIEELLTYWLEDYEILEDRHTYIQWLFPLREEGMNWHATPLTQREIQEFKMSAEVMDRLIQAYELMLGFYGIRLVSRETGEVARAENWKERFRNLNGHTHNNLRITRILKCLGEMGFEHYQASLVKFFLKETLVEGTLPNVKQSALDYFLFTIRNKQQRRVLVHYAWKHFSPRENFVWGTLKKLERFEAQQQKTAMKTGCTDSRGEDETAEEYSTEEETRSQPKTVMSKDASQGSILDRDSKSEAGNSDKGEIGHQSPSADMNANNGTGLGMAKDCKKRKLESPVTKNNKNGTEQTNSPDVDAISSSFQEISMVASAVDEKGTTMQTEDMRELDDTAMKRRKKDQAKAEKGSAKVPESLDNDLSQNDVKGTSTEEGCIDKEPLKQVKDILKMEFSQSDDGSRLQNSTVSSDSLLLTQQPHPEGGLEHENNTATFSSENKVPALCDEALLPNVDKAESTVDGVRCMELGKEIEKGVDPGGDGQKESSVTESAEGAQDRSSLTNGERFTEALSSRTATKLADVANELNQKKEDVPTDEVNGMEMEGGNSEHHPAKDISGSPQTPIPIQ